MELVPIIKSLMFYGTLFFVILIAVSYIISKIKNTNKRENERAQDLIPNYLERPASLQNIRIVKSSQNVLAQKPITAEYKSESKINSFARETQEIRRKSEEAKYPVRESRTRIENQNVYQIKNNVTAKQTVPFDNIQSGPTIADLKKETKRFVVLNTNTNVENGTDGLLNRFSKSYSY